MFIIYSPEDFVVSEINSAGKVVELNSYEVPPLPPPPPQATSSETSRKEADTSRKWVGVSSRPDPSDVPPLHELVSSKEYIALEQLANGYRETLVADPNVTVDLGMGHCD